jgi:DNA-binding MarR family transcriptional regulator
MKLEEAIKQTKFKHEHHKVLLNLIYTAGVINAAQTRFFKAYDISPQQYNVLRILRGQHPNVASVGLVQERMLDQMSNASRLVEKLKQKKLLSRKECKVDRRQVDLVITESGLSVLDEIDKNFEDFEMNLAKLNKDEAQTLNLLLDKLCE